MRDGILIGVDGLQPGLSDGEYGRPFHPATDAEPTARRTTTGRNRGFFSRRRQAALTALTTLLAFLVALAVLVQITDVQAIPTAAATHHNDLLRNVGIAHQRAAPDVHQTLGDLEAAKRGLCGDHRRHGRADPRHQAWRFIRQFAQALGDVGQTTGHGIRHWAKGIADRTHGVIHALGHFCPFLRRGLTTLFQVPVQDPAGIG
ncbi:hypothetical protein D3C86_1524720 [compost metagenome]